MKYIFAGFRTIRAFRIGVDSVLRYEEKDPVGNLHEDEVLNSLASFAIYKVHGSGDLSVISDGAFKLEPNI
jgi:hypothetical protein